MIKAIIRVIYSGFISIIFILVVTSVWTGYIFVSQPTKFNEIIYFIQDIYQSQKTVINDFLNLSKLLINDKEERIFNENNNI